MRILVIRRDNIGDLVCTTPLFSALRSKYPHGWIGALVNSYNAPVLEGNPDLDEVIAYTKLKHLDEGESRLAAMAARVRSLWRLRRMRLDAVVLATTHTVPRLVRLARWLAPKRVVEFSEGLSTGRHEVERVFSLARAFAIDGPIPPLRVVPPPVETERALRLAPQGAHSLAAVHISARRPAQRWPAERFVELIQRLHSENVASLLLWSPGASDHPRHPGDDDKAKRILESLPAGVLAAACRTDRLQELIGALAACDSVVCSDGGAMHIAAALGKPIACFFGDSPVERWHPWGVPYRVLRPSSGRVSDVTAEDALSALRDFLPR